VTATDTPAEVIVLTGQPENCFSRLVAGDVGDDIVARAVELLAAAGRPMSLPELCNALWFARGSDGSYDGVAVNSLLDEVREISHGYPAGKDPSGPQPAVALGQIVSLTIGEDMALGEVIWKEGAHPCVDGGWVPGWLAGAPAEDPQLPHVGGEHLDGAVPAGSRALTERLVIDFGCFGPGLPPRPAQLDRLRSKGQRLDRYGHVVIDALYAAGDDEADDVSFWAATVARNHPRSLTAVGIPVDAAAVAEGASLLAAALAERADVRTFGTALVHADVYADRVAADDAGDLRRVVRGLSQLSPQMKLAWASMSARLGTYLSEEELLGCGWPTSVVCASLYALDVLASEAPDGNWHDVHLRLDDPWQGGGLWRAERLDTVGPVAADPAIALGLGWIEHTGGDIERRNLPEADPGDDVELDPDDVIGTPDWFDGLDDDDEEFFDVTGSEAVWTVHVTAADLDTDRLRVPKVVSEALRARLIEANQNQFAIALQHDGSPEVRTFVSLGDDGHVTVLWPFGIQPGVTVRCLWTIGSTLVTAATKLLNDPEEVAGITYTHEYNLRVALAAAGFTDGGSNVVTIRQLVRAAVRRYGDLTEDGRLALSLDRIVTCCFGPDGQVLPGYQMAVLRRAVLGAVAGLRVTGIAELYDDLVIVAQSGTIASRKADQELIARYLESTRERLRVKVSRHWVPPTVVTFRYGQQRSAEKDATFPQVAGTDGLPRKLADNQTWRRGFPRGGSVSPEVRAAVERAQRAIAALTHDPAAAAQLEAVAADPFAEEPPPDAPGAS
jgi:hypothetical protein